MTVCRYCGKTIEPVGGSWYNELDFLMCGKTFWKLPHAPQGIDLSDLFALDAELEALEI